MITGYQLCSFKPKFLSNAPIFISKASYLAFSGTLINEIYRLFKNHHSNLVYVGITTFAKKEI